MFASVERFEIIPDITRIIEPNSSELSTNKREGSLSMKEEAERIGMPEHCVLQKLRESGETKVLLAWNS